MIHPSIYEVLLPGKKKKMFSDLPQEIALNILSRIPIKTVFAGKCVCKSWQTLIETAEFARSHLSYSAPGLLVNQSIGGTTMSKIFDFEEDSADDHELHYKRVLESDIFNQLEGSGVTVEGSANGLVFFRKSYPIPNDYYVCNPITREYINLPNPDGEGVQNHLNFMSYGFGISRSSGQYKVVRIFYQRHATHSPITPKKICQVYTLGSRSSWRSVDIPPDYELLDYDCSSKGAFLNGNLHWLVNDVDGSWWVSCFDLETEAFTLFDAPMIEPGRFLMGMRALGDCLCFCDNSSDGEIVMYLMSSCSYEQKSWKKELVLSKSPDYAGDREAVVTPIKYFGDGDVLMDWEAYRLFCYSNSTRMTEPIGMFNLNGSGSVVQALLYTPSFVSLRDFEADSVTKF